MHYKTTNRVIAAPCQLNVYFHFSALMRFMLFVDMLPIEQKQNHQYCEDGYRSHDVLLLLCTLIDLGIYPDVIMPY
jgi:hypothetical protein